MFLLVLLAACGGSSDDGGRAAGTTAPAGAPTTASSTTTTAPPSCPPGGAQPGPGWESVQWEATDFDGDGKPDAVYRGSQEVARLRIIPTTGAANEVKVPTAKPYSHLTGIDVDGNRRQEAMIGINGPDDTRVRVLVYADCKVDWLLNEQGQPYEFVAKGGTDTSGDGVGCVDNDGDGKLDLVGIHWQHQGDAYRWERTTVRIEGRRGVNGNKTSGTFAKSDERARDASSSATCGDKTLVDE